jgi:DHA1 family bicyclomycin/chloramphenicol resistance-like MFS transporter
MHGTETETMNSAQPNRQHFGLIVMIGTMSLFGPLAINMNLPGIVQTGHDLHTSTAAIQATMAAFMFGFAAGQLIWGALADRWGRRQPAFLGLGIFLVTSILCALAQSEELLFGARLIQGFGACSGIVLARAIVSDNFKGSDAAVIFSWQHLIMGMAPILAPLIGGALLLIFSWRSIFWVLAIMAALIIPVLFVKLPESRSQEAADHARSEGRIAAYWAVISHRRVLAHILTGGLSASALMTWYSAASPLFQEDFRWSARTTSIIIGILGVTIVGGSQINRRLLKRYTPRQIIEGSLFGGIVLFVAALLLTIANVPGAPVIATIGIVLGVSTYGMLSANNQACALELDRRRAGSVGALVGAANYGIGAFFAWLISRLPSLHGVTMLAMMAFLFIAARLALGLLNPHGAISHQSERQS